MVRYLLESRLDKVPELMPSTIEQASKGTPISVVCQVVDPKKVEAFIAFELIKLASLVNVDQRLNIQEHQVNFIASQLMTQYKNENLADFALCFKRGAMGMYGEIFRLDGAVIAGWMQQYMEQKYQFIESELIKEKDEYYKTVIPTNSDRDWHSEWLKAISQTEGIRAATQMTREEIESEGQEWPKKLSYPSTSLSEIEIKERHIQYIRQNYDARTGQPLPGYLTEKEWNEKQGKTH
jgi:hypothetical protein